MPQDTNSHPLTLVDGVFEGGGCLGGAYVGALRCFRDRGYWFKRAAGSSAGAIIASLVAAGYTPEEFEWLMRHDVQKKPATLPNSPLVQKIAFSSFLDAPLKANEIALSVRRNNILWMTITGSIIDRLAADIQQQITASTGQLQGALVSALSGYVGLIDKRTMSTKIKSAILGDVNGVLKNFPGGSALAGAMSRTLTGTANSIAQMIIDTIEAGLKSTAALTKKIVAEVERAVRQFLAEVFASFNAQRMRLADEIVLAVIDSDPAVRIYVNLVGHKRIFKGDAFLTQMRNLIQAKAFQRGLIRRIDQPVTFGVLAGADAQSRIDLYVTTTDMSAKAGSENSLVVYSTRDAATAEKEVAMAVRESMSIPGLFEPCADKRGRKVLVDGGLTSNLPMHLFLQPANNTAEDAARQIVVFTLQGGGDDKLKEMGLEKAPEGRPSHEIVIEKLMGRSLDAADKRVLARSALPYGATAVPDTQAFLSGGRNSVNVFAGSAEYALVAFVLDVGMRYRQRGANRFDAELFNHLLGHHPRITSIPIMTSSFDWLNFELNSDPKAAEIIASYGWAWTHRAMHQRDAYKDALLERAPSAVELEFDAKAGRLLAAIKTAEKDGKDPKALVAQYDQLLRQYERDIEDNPFTAKKPSRKQIAIDILREKRSGEILSILEGPQLGGLRRRP